MVLYLTPRAFLRSAFVMYCTVLALPNHLLETQYCSFSLSRDFVKIHIVCIKLDSDAAANLPVLHTVQCTVQFSLY